MKFLKEMCIIVAILIFVIFIEVYTNGKLEKKLDVLGGKIGEIEQNLEDSNDKIGKIKDDWKKENDILSLFVDHNELEKLSKSLNFIEVNVKNNDFDEARENISELKFMIEHIKEKNSLELKNVF